MLSTADKRFLLQIAHDSILHGLRFAGQMPLDPKRYPASLQQKRASFVSLFINQRMRGCVGSLKASQPLAVNVAENAYNAAFRDPRYTPLSPLEAQRVEIHVAVLGDLHPIEFGDEPSLLEQMEAGTGIVFNAGPRRSTFLPSVWKQFSTPSEFLRQLKQAAGVPESYWGDDISVQYYRLEEFSEATLETESTDSGTS